MSLSTLLTDAETEALKTIESDGANQGLQFESAEHVTIGNNVQLQFPDGTIKAGDLQISLENHLQLTYGQILALGGDFYGVVGQPISDGATQAAREKYFQDAYNTLAQNPASKEEAGKILQVMQKEIDAVEEAIKNGQSVADVYKKLGDSLSHEWNGITGGSSTCWVPAGRYLKLAGENWDHFGQNAVKAYQAGHALALAKAKAAAALPVSEQKAALEQAYALNAFADHFLTDLFSAGHLRTPRKALTRFASIFSASSDSGYMKYISILGLGGLLAREMHNEDGVNGLWVSNKRGDEWMSYGDGQYYEKAGEKNASLANEAAQISANEVYQVFSGAKEIPAPAAFAALELIPDLEKVQDYKNTGKNFSPMFVDAFDKVLLREDINNPMWKNWPTSGDEVIWSPLVLYIRFFWFGAYKGPNWHLQTVNQ